MGRRYYCDYCDKTFIDDVDARKKHLQSAHHVKLRNLHYESCREPEVILRQELLKIPCRRFNEFGNCQFEGNCKYSHYTPVQLSELRIQVEQAQIQRMKKSEEIPTIPSVESWLQKNAKSFKEGDVIDTFWNYPLALESRTDLPPSLVKFRPEHFYDDNFEEWGT